MKTLLAVAVLVAVSACAGGDDGSSTSSVAGETSGSSSSGTGKAATSTGGTTGGSTTGGSSTGSKDTTTGAPCIATNLNCAPSGEACCSGECVDGGSHYFLDSGIELSDGGLFTCHGP